MNLSALMKPAALAALLLATACGGGGGAPAPVPSAVDNVAEREILANTNDTALPISVDQGIEEEALSETALPVPI